MVLNLETECPFLDFTRKGILFCCIKAVIILGGVSDDFKSTYAAIISNNGVG